MTTRILYSLRTDPFTLYRTTDMKAMMDFCLYWNLSYMEVKDEETLLDIPKIQKA